MDVKLLVFDSHPVQYRVPIWQTLEKIVPGSVHVVYASDCSVRGHADQEFGRTVVWDEPMLAGYAHTILMCEKGDPLSGWGSLTGAGVKQILNEIKPTAVLITGLNYRYDLVAYLQARFKGIPVWLRCETQDYAIKRTGTKIIIRSALYELMYSGLSRCFFIGELNRQHYLQHGVSPTKLRPARYGTIDRSALLTEKEKEHNRIQARRQARIPPENIAIGFSGKFIDKKNPEILFQMLALLPNSLRGKVHLYFMGSGPLEQKLQQHAQDAHQKFGVHTFFAGFVNQTQLINHYLAMDIMVLPSRRMGETWGLVANEAMQAGCGVVVSDAVGCSVDFKGWERFRVFDEGDAQALASCISELAHYPRSFGWAQHMLQPYSIRASATALAEELLSL